MIARAEAAWAGMGQRSRTRLLGLAVGAPAWGVLVIARWLVPAAQGFGTHRQLGLSSCSMLSVTGWPCPMCGMTTTFALLADGRVVDAFVNQPFGPVLFLATVLAAGGGVVDAVTGSGVLERLVARVRPIEARIASLLFAGMVLGWLYKCVRLHPELFLGA